MTTWIELKTEAGAKHPESDSLASSPLALLLLTLVRENNDVFGYSAPITVYVCDLLDSANTNLSPDSINNCVSLTPLRFPAQWFRDNPLSSKAEQFIRAVINDFTARQRKK